MKRSVVVFCSWIMEAEGDNETELRENAKKKVVEFFEKEDSETIVDCGLDEMIVDED